MQSNTRLYTVATFILILVVGISSLGYGFIAPLRALYARNMGVSSLDISFMVAAASLTGFVFTPIIGWLADRLGSRLVLMVALLLHGVLVLLYLPVHSSTGMILLRALEGITIAGVFPPARALMNLTAPEGRQGEAMGLLTSARATGTLLGPASGSFLASLVGYDASFIVSAASLVIGGFVVLFFLQEVQANRHSSALLRSMFTRTFSRELILPYSLAFITALPIGLVGAIWSLYMADRGATLAQIGLSYTTFAIPGLVLTPLIGRWADRTGRFTPLFIGLICSGFVYLVYALPLGPWPIILVSIIEGLVVTIARNAADGILADVVPPQQVGQIQANYSAMGTAGSFIASVASGALYGYGPGTPLLAIGLVFVTMSLTLFIPAVKRLFPNSTA